jgi:hypothetical protein
VAEASVPKKDEPQGGFWFAFSSWRVLSLTMLSVSSGMPFNIVDALVPTWM